MPDSQFYDRSFTEESTFESTEALLSKRHSLTGECSLDQSLTHGDSVRSGAVLQKKQRKAKFAFFIWLMIVVCVSMMVWEMYENKWIFEPFSRNPMFGPSIETMIKCGGKDTSLIVGEGEWWRIISPMFLHGGLIHLGFNMMGLFQVGRDLEWIFGTVRIGFLYVISGIAATLFSAVFVPREISVGASGAIFGLFGALWADVVQNYSTLPKGRCKYIGFLFLQTVFSLGFGLLPWLDNYAHLGGFCCGFCTGLCLLVDPRAKKLGGLRLLSRYLLRVLGAAVTALSCATLLGLLYSGMDPDSFCNWCHYLTCVPTPWWTCNVDMAGTCTFESLNSTLYVSCPDGNQFDIGVNPMDEATCRKFCFS